MWCWDFASGRTVGGTTLKRLSIVDEYTRECVAQKVERHQTSEGVVRALAEVSGGRGFPRSIRVDNGPEFISRSLDWWAYFHGVKLDFSRPGKPTDNAFIESFNGKFREECLNQHWFLSLQEAQATMDAWREDYNGCRPHSSLGNRTPSEFASCSAGARPR